MHSLITKVQTYSHVKWGFSGELGGFPSWLTWVPVETETTSLLH